MSLPTLPESGKFRVLVVEDDHNIARLILATLTRAGFECRYAPDGTEGWDAFRATDPHLVLADLMMPGMNGQELCAKIRETSTIPLIVVTAADTEDAQLQSFKAGADDYVAKPFSPKLLTARVIANLRRVYRYDFSGPAVGVKAEQAHSIPAGWGQCQRCYYMGPQEKFPTRIENDEPVRHCPVCGQSENIAYSIA